MYHRKKFTDVSTLTRHLQFCFLLVVKTRCFWKSLPRVLTAMQVFNKLQICIIKKIEKYPCQKMFTKSITFGLQVN